MTTTASHLWLDRLALALLGLLCLSLAFEWQDPIVWLGASVPLTPMKAHMLAVVALTAGLAMLRRDRAGILALRSLRPTLLLLGAFVVSGLLAPEHRGNALKFTMRWGLMSGLLLATEYLAWNRRRRLGLLACLCVGLVPALAACLAEVLSPTLFFAWLRPFRPEQVVINTPIGIYKRLQGTFLHPNILAGYLAVLVPLTITSLAALLMGLRGRIRFWLSCSLAVLGVSMATGLAVLTVSRGGLLCLGLALVSLAGVAAWRRGSSRPDWLLAGLAGGAMAGVAGAALLCEVLHFRLGLYRPQLQRQAIIVPPVLSDLAGHTDLIVIPVKPPVVNSSPGRVCVLAKLTPLAVDSTAVPGSEAGPATRRIWRDALPAHHNWTIRNVPLLYPAVPGAYRATWTVVAEPGTWFQPEFRWYGQTLVLSHGKAAFREEIVRGAFTGSVNQARASLELRGRMTARDPLRSEPPRPELPERRVLWQAGWTLFKQRPWTGIGPDNFHLCYHQAVGLPAPDSQARAHSLYVETAVNLGLLGLGALLFFGGSVARAWASNIRASVDRRQRLIEIGIGLGVGVFFLHGLVDYFLGLTNMMALFAVLGGLIWTRQGQAPGLAARLATGPDT